MKDVAGDEDELRRNLDDLVDRVLERLRDVGLTLIDAARREPLILAESEVQVGEMDEAQSGLVRERLAAANQLCLLDLDT